MTAKLSRPKRRSVDPTLVQGQLMDLTWGDLALHLKGRRDPLAEREVSRGHSSEGLRVVWTAPLAKG
jgi:hypothetical protein